MTNMNEIMNLLTGDYKYITGMLALLANFTALFSHMQKANTNVISSGVIILCITMVAFILSRL